MEDMLIAGKKLSGSRILLLLNLYGTSGSLYNVA